LFGLRLCVSSPAWHTSVRALKQLLREGNKLGKRRRVEGESR
jgi:hypothetical protein